MKRIFLVQCAILSCLSKINAAADTPLPFSESQQSAKSSTGSAPFVVGDRYDIPEDPTISVNENDKWRFAFAPDNTPQSPDYDDANWKAVQLPHTWNAVDGASTDYAQGAGWYRKIFSIPSSIPAGKRLYLRFGAGSIKTSLYIDGVQIDLNPETSAIDSHLGAFQAFDFDVTTALNAPPPNKRDGHVVAIKVSNSSNPNVPPGGWGDYSKEGGLYRDLSLVAVSPAHAALTRRIIHTGLSGEDSPSKISSPAVQFTNSPVVVGAASAKIQITTTLDNLGAGVTVAVTTYLVDNAGVIRAMASSKQVLNPSETGVSVSQNATVDHPRLWDGRIDPYLYTLYAEIHDIGNNRLLDLQKLQVGIRSFQINAKPDLNSSDPLNRAPFVLNGHPYRLVGADMHQDSGAKDGAGNPVGWARSEAQIHADIDMFAEMGGTAIRTSHYQDNRSFYEYCDKLGVLVYTESPINGLVTPGDAFLSNAQDQYSELVHQTMNSPSVFAWGFGNETGSSPSLVTIFKQFNQIAHDLDPTRKTAFAQYGGSQSTGSNADGVPDIKGTHLYDYWYGGASHPDRTRAAYPSQPLGVTEYGGGASAYQYADTFTLPVSSHPGGVKTHFHPANQQTRLEELQYTDLTSLSYLWGQFTWQMYDNASSGKNEGDQGGVNDKGLATRDRVRKDSYYFYKANLNDPSRKWVNQRVLYISDRFWTARKHPECTVTVFSNVGPPTLTLNGLSLGAMKPYSAVAGNAAASPGTMRVIPATYTMDVKLSADKNTLQANCTYLDGKKYTDSATWTYRDRLEGTPVAKIDFLAAGQTAPVDYLADHGEEYGPRNGQTYGWRTTSGPLKSFSSDSPTDPSANGFILNYDPIFKTSSIWEFKLPNGVYDVEIGTDHAGKGSNVNMLELEGEVAAIDSDPNNVQSSFYHRVTVTNGYLTLTAGAGAFQPRITYLKFNKMSDAHLGR